MLENHDRQNKLDSYFILKVSMARKNRHKGQEYSTRFWSTILINVKLH